jgi:DNA-binding MarR family transcriptional regulator
LSRTEATDGEVPLTPMIGALMRRPLHALSVRVAADLASAGFTDLRPAHLTVFQQLDADGSRLTDLAARAHMTKQSMGALVDDLERLGYVERLPDAVDGRVKIVRRTERGWAVEHAARESVGAFEADWTARVGEERMRQFRRVLEEFEEAPDAETIPRGNGHESLRPRSHTVRRR